MMNMQAEPLNLKEATVTCIPRLRGGGLGRRPRRRGGSPSSSTAAGAPVSVLDRLRDVMLRLAMLSAASSSATSSKGGGGGAASLQRTGTRVSPAAAKAYADTYRSEAVDDCIEFLKRSAAGGGGGAAVEASTGTAAAAAAASPLHVPCES
ncbi:hypothetical protein ACP4OV_010259 [Aristida adscensionis]